VVKVTQVENGEFLRNLAQLIQPHTADIEDEFTDFLLSPQADRLARTQFSVNTANEQISFEGVSYDVGNMS
jgi:hypothetical protein